MSNKSESITELAKALCKAQGQMPPAKMNAINPFLKNKYADLGSVIEASRKPLSDNGLSISQLMTGSGTEMGITTILMHESGEWIESTVMLPVMDEKGVSPAQVAGKIISYLRRYALSAILGIYADEDADGNKEGEKNAKTQKAKPVKVATPTNGGAPMTLDEANNVTNSKGELYGSLDSDTLRNMANAISKAKTPKPEHDKKLLAIHTILKARSEAG